MVSQLWMACSDGDLDNVRALLNASSNLEIEVRDHTGATPLLQAVKNGHVEIVRVLLDHGADPTSAFNEGRPAQYTSDFAVLDLLRRAQDKVVPRDNLHENGYRQDAPEGVDKHYYAPPGAYPYYPTLNHAPPPMPDGASGYYPPPHGSTENPVSGGLGNLPPPEIAKSIPCRYFPACRYGSSCMFAHPQTPYYQGPVPPPAPYMHYDPSLGPQPYGSNFYPVPPPPFQQPNGIPHMAPLSPPPGPPPLVHGRSQSDVMPPTPNPYTPGGISPLPYGSMLPPVYPPQGQAHVPMQVPPNVHPMHPVPQSPTAMYNQPPLPNPIYNGRPDVNGSYPPPPPNESMAYPEANGDPSPTLFPQSDGFMHSSQAQHRDGSAHGRRGGRRSSFNSRKPACIFYPSGRCKNGDECRFPHVMPDGSGNQNASFYRTGGRVRGNNNGNGYTPIDEKLANLNIRDDQPRHDTLIRSGGNNGRAKFDRGPRNHGGNLNDSHVSKRQIATKQRVPNADEFPVLGGSTTPPSRQSNGIPNGIPTAAQVLQGPRPTKKDTSQSNTRGTSPDCFRNNGTKGSMGATPEASASPVPEQNITASFVVVASDISKEVAVSA
ncbi:hypothetical protein APHAL10511_006062 [Amanita phalloides]|nr:hypothetical protein APHAL10511_006062 [Amanita phalloides]